MFTKVAVLLAIFSVAYCGQLTPETEAALSECAKEYDIPMESIKAHEEPPEDKKCINKCFAVKMGVMSEDGQPHFDVLKAKLEEHNAPAHFIANLDKCSQIKMDDHCDLAKAIWKCIKESQQ